MTAIHAHPHPSTPRISAPVHEPNPTDPHHLASQRTGPEQPIYAAVDRLRATVQQTANPTRSLVSP
jgi:hypothetical protein